MRGQRSSTGATATRKIGWRPATTVIGIILAAAGGIGIAATSASASTGHGVQVTASRTACDKADIQLPDTNAGEQGVSVVASTGGNKLTSSDGATSTSTWVTHVTGTPASAYTLDVTVKVTGKPDENKSFNLAAGEGCVTKPTVNLSANPTSVQLGSATVLTWSSTNATSLKADGAWTGGKAISGTESVKPDMTGTVIYTLTATGPGGSITATAMVTVTEAPPSCTPGKVQVTPLDGHKPPIVDGNVLYRATHNNGCMPVEVKLHWNYATDTTPQGGPKDAPSFNKVFVLNGTDGSIDVSTPAPKPIKVDGVWYCYIQTDVKIDGKLVATSHPQLPGQCGDTPPPVTPKDASGDFQLVGVCGPNNDTVGNVTVNNAVAGTPSRSGNKVSITFNAVSGHLFANGTAVLIVTKTEVNTTACATPPPTPSPTSPVEQCADDSLHLVNGKCVAVVVQTPTKPLGPVVDTGLAPASNSQPMLLPWLIIAVFGVVLTLTGVFSMFRNPAPSRR